ncbi:MAG: hypothetical protein IKM87_08760 [Clostridia bacterium]|nr:hypothetical protein [Clostridia bacterium]
MKSEGSESKRISNRHIVQVRLRKDEYERLEGDALRLGIKPSLLAYMAVKGLRIKDRVPESLIYKLSVLEEKIGLLSDMKDSLMMADNEDTVRDITELIIRLSEILLSIERMYIYPEGGRR